MILTNIFAAIVTALEKMLQSKATPKIAFVTARVVQRQHFKLRIVQRAGPSRYTVAIIIVMFLYCTISGITSFLISHRVNLS